MTTADTDSTTLEAFVVAAAQGDSDTIKSLLENRDDPSPSFASTLCAAAYNGHLEIIKLLIARGADINTNDDGETALQSAVRGAQIHIIQSLIEAGADVRVRLPEGASALHQAVTTDQATKTEAALEIIDQLLRYGLEMEIQDDEGRTPLHEAAFYGRVDLMNGLIARGAMVNAKDKWQDTPLDRACLNGYIEAVELLVSRGANVNAHSGGCEGLGRAARSGRMDLVSFLLDSGANPLPANNEGPELLHAARSGVPELVVLLMDRGFSSQGPRSLLRAVLMDSVQVVAQLLDYGVPIEVKNTKQQNLLHLAVLGKKWERQTLNGVLNSRNEVIKLLIEKGADVSATDAKSQKTIDDPKFSKNLDDVLNALKGVMADANAKIYWTGYAHFWDTSTNGCDKVTWALKYNIGHRQYLTQDRRTTMNKLVDAVNQKIQDAIRRFGDQAIFVPWGPDVDYIGGHFCEPGVDESNAIDREQTAFYEWGTTKDQEGGSDHDELRRRQEPGQLQEGQDLRKTWEGAIAGWISDAIKDRAKPEDFGLSEKNVVQAQSGLLLPDKYGRIFHPTRFAHMMIAENILRTMDLTKARSMGKKAATTTLLGCPLPTGPASHLGEHNKCYNDDQKGNNGKFKISDADKVIKNYCLEHQGDTVMSGPDGILEKYQNSDDKGDSNTMDEKYGGGKTADCISYTIRAMKETTSSGSPKPNPERTCSLHLAQGGVYSVGNGSGVRNFANFDTPFVYTVEVTNYDGTGDDKKQIGHSDKKEAGDGNPLKVKMDKAEGIGDYAGKAAPL
ncbi:MAG: hypothetical protein Q9182_004658 [Xanthomendoza sp. 2 TL-2023]